MNNLKWTYFFQNEKFRFIFDTGGGISIKLDDKIYIAPSGVQKERLVPNDLFVQDMSGNDLELPPPEKKLKKSQCTPLFMCAYKFRNAGKYSTSNLVLHIFTINKYSLMIV